MHATGHDGIILPLANPLSRCRQLHPVRRPLIIGGESRFRVLHEVKIDFLLPIAIHKDENAFLRSSAMTTRPIEHDDRT
jgi:hypothetical protein